MLSPPTDRGVLGGLGGELLFEFEGVDVEGEAARVLGVVLGDGGLDGVFDVGFKFSVVFAGVVGVTHGEAADRGGDGVL